MLLGLSMKKSEKLEHSNSHKLKFIRKWKKSIEMEWNEYFMNGMQYLIEICSIIPEISNILHRWNLISASEALPNVKKILLLILLKCVWIIFFFFSKFHKSMIQWSSAFMNSSFGWWLSTNFWPTFNYTIQKKRNRKMAPWLWNP